MTRMAELDPIVNDLDAPFWDGARAGRLMLPFCLATGRAFWPPSPLSPHVSRGAVEWRVVEPVGVLQAVVIFRRSYHQALAARMPYGIGQVALDAGPRLQAHIVDPDGIGAPRAGDRVRLDFAALIEGGPAVPIACRLR